MEMKHRDFEGYTTKKNPGTVEAIAAAPTQAQLGFSRLLNIPPEVFNEVLYYLTYCWMISQFFIGDWVFTSSRPAVPRAIEQKSPKAVHVPLISVQVETGDRQSTKHASVSLRTGRAALHLSGLLCNMLETPYQMDPYLLVRLCEKCENIQTIPVHELDPLLLLVPTNYAMPSEREPIALAEEYRIVSETDERNDEDSGWYKNRMRIRRERESFGKKLSRFLSVLEAEREAKVRVSKLQIEERIVKLGWKALDMTSSPANFPKWNEFIYRTEPITDQVWVGLYPKLVPYLETNREDRRRVRRETERSDRFQVINLMATAIQKALPPLVRVTKKRPTKDQTSGSASAALSAHYASVRIDYPFPSSYELLTWPMINDIIDKDI
ncbi:hypothetical protein RhiJN_16481 [Ceratobasidium sp. AG-Ba]|nr:hypothetical protein RhiJN_16481 [Ceratobasidium sp. AG-Ba]